MEEKRKSRPWALWVVVALVVLVVYPLSAGPYLMMLRCGAIPERLEIVTDAIYWPVFYLIEVTPKGFPRRTQGQEACSLYLEWWVSIGR